VAEHTGNAKGEGPGRGPRRGPSPLPGERPSALPQGERDRQPGGAFYIALYWAQALAAQDQDAELRARFAPVARALQESEAKITDELLAAQGQPVDLGGYYLLGDERAAKAMRPSATLNAIIDGMK